LNYVTKKEEIVKSLLEVEAMGSAEGLSPQEAKFHEFKIMEKLNIAKGVGVKLAKQVPRSNAILLQTEEGAGTKGATANLGQIMGVYGQTYLSGERFWTDMTWFSSL